MSTLLTYAVVTPARDEAENLRRLAASILAQRARPRAWAIVDDGSSDPTPAVASALAREHDWILSLESPGARVRGGELGEGRRTGRDVLAFNAGLDAVGELPDVVVKLDADVSLDPDYFERLLACFDEDPRLGIASGLCWEQEDGEWVPRHVTAGHVRGATRAYRRECFEEVSPLEERLGWDGVDELKAAMRGWRTHTFTHIGFRHHRAVGQRDGMWRAFAAQGETAHYMGYRFSYLALRALHHARRDRAALAMISSYVRAAVRREPRVADRELRAYLRRHQSPRNLGARAREALGRPH